MRSGVWKGREEEDAKNEKNAPPTMADYADTHPRIPLNSEKDWQTIQDTITHALLQSIDAQFASEGIDPALKSYVTKQALKVCPSVACP